MAYPYIGKGTESGSIVLFYEREQGVTLKSKSWASENLEFHTQIDEDYFKNITADHLRNTYGKVESKEHAEFIKLLADNEGIKCNYMVVSDEIKYFYFSGGVLFFAFDRIDDGRFKLITIPLPPKDESMKSQKEWPQVGEDILYDGSSERLKEIKGETVKVIGRYSFDDAEYITVNHNEHGVFAMRLGSWIKKPPTPEEELRTKLISVMDNSNTAFAYADFISKAIINGEIEGLEYKPQ